MYGILPEIETSTGMKVQGYPVLIPNPEKTAVLRLPTNDEMMQWMRAQKSIYRDLGRRMGESEDVPNPAADKKLFDAIRIDKDGVEFDAAEMVRAIGLITRHRVVSCTRSGQEYEIILRTFLGDVLHHVRIPYEKELAEYRRHVYKPRDLPNNLEERRFPPEVPVKLYDAVVQSVTAFDGPLTDAAGNRDLDGPTPVAKPVSNPTDWTPPHHKRSVIAELTSAMSALDPALDPNF